MPRRNRDAITAARLAFLDPVLNGDGWARQSDRRFFRLRDEILQEITVFVTPQGDRRFEVRWDAGPLFIPHDRVTFPGGWLSPGGRGWEGATHEQADASMRAAARLVDRFVLPWMERRDGVEAFLDTLQEEQWSFVDRQLFVAGACLARLGRRSLARENLRRAMTVFRERHEDVFHRATWVDACQRLQQALADGEEQELLDRWLVGTARARNVPRTWYEDL